MRLTRLGRRAAVIAAIALGMMGCAGSGQTPEQRQAEAFADVQSEIRAAVADPARAEQAVALVAQLQRNFDASRLEMQAHKDKLRVLYADYDSPRVEFEREFGAIQQEIQHVNAYFSRLSAELQSLLTSEEEQRDQQGSQQVHRVRYQFTAGHLRGYYPCSLHS